MEGRGCDVIPDFSSGALKIHVQHFSVKMLHANTLPAAEY